MVHRPQPGVTVASILPFPSAASAPSSKASVVERSATKLVRELRANFRSGRTRTAEWRRVQLAKLRRFLVEEEESVLAALRQDLGKPRYEAVTGEIALLHSEIDVAQRNLTRWMAPERVSVPLVHQPASARVEREALGVVLIIGPWNYPLQLVLGPLVSAIAAGNVAVLGPSEHAPATAELLARRLNRYLDPGAVRVFAGGVSEARALLAQRFDHVFFTGGAHVGRIVLEAAAKHLTPVTLELGGKSPAIVDASADIGVAARRIAWGRFYNAGQTCVAPDYVLVERGVASALREALIVELRRFYGEDPLTSPDYARIVNRQHLARLEGLLEGVPVIHGGRSDAERLILEPTIVWDVEPQAAVMQEEIFGPILPVLPVDDLDSAIDFVAARPDPLALYLFSSRRQAQERVRQGTRSGGLVFNDVIVHLTVPGLPFGGLGPSGMGASHGRAGFETFSHRRSVMRRASWFDPSVRYPPYSEGKLRIARALL